MRKKNRGLYIGIILAVVAVLFCVGLFVINDLILGMADVREMTIESGTDWWAMKASPTGGATDVVYGKERKPMTYYSSVKEAVEASREGECEIGEENKLFEVGDGLIFSVYIENNFMNEIQLVCFLMNAQDGLYSYPLYIWTQAVESTMFGWQDYDDECRVVRDIALSYAFHNVMEQANDGIPFFYGIGMGEQMEGLTILGKRPDGLDRITYKGKEYYYWYFIDGTEIMRKCDAYQEFPNMTIGEAIEYFQIRLGKTE